jgi:hypothetical protein
LDRRISISIAIDELPGRATMIHVDLSPAHVLKEPVQTKTAREAVFAF